jgi:hypothetical protein
LGLAALSAFPSPGEDQRDYEDGGYRGRCESDEEVVAVGTGPELDRRPSRD